MLSEEVKQIDRSVGQAVVDWRKSLGWTQEGLAKRIGSAKSTVARIEMGQGASFATIAKIAFITRAVFVIEPDGRARFQEMRLP